MSLKSASVAVIINVILLVFLTIFLGGLGSANYMLARSDKFEKLDSIAHHTAERLQFNVAGALWDIDKERAVPVLMSEMKDRNIAGIAVWEGKTKDILFIGGLRDSEWKSRTVEDNWKAPKGTPVSLEVKKDGDILGSVDVYLTEQFLRKELDTILFNTVLSVLVIDIIMILGLYIAFGRVLVRPLKRLEAFATEVGRGELGCSIPEGTFMGELGNLRDALTQMVCSLGETIETVREKEKEAQESAKAADVQRQQAEEAREEAVQSRKEGMVHAADILDELVRKITNFTQELSQQVDGVKDGTDHQRARIDETVDALGEMNATVFEVAKSSQTASGHAQDTSERAADGTNIVGQSVSAIRTVNERAEQLQENMRRLQGKADDIGSVIGVINDIADQTNLLALNAAIEAARAGDAGRGFAVVADEVRKLAEKTMTATKDVSVSITDIQKETQQSLTLTGEVGSSVDEATGMAEQTSTALEGIKEIAVVTSDQISRIATAAEEQSATAEHIASSVEDISRVALENAQGMNEAASALNELAQLTSRLDQLVDELKNS